MRARVPGRSPPPAEIDITEARNWYKSHGGLGTTRMSWASPVLFCRWRLLVADSSDSEIVFAVEEAPEGGFVAHALGVPIFTEADTFEELHAKVREAVSCHFDEAEGPKVIRLHLVRDEVLIRDPFRIQVKRDGLTFVYLPRVSSGLSKERPGKRLKSRSVLQSVKPCSMARAAR